MQFIYRIDIFEENYNIVRDRSETDSINVMKNRSLVVKKQRKSYYILAASVYQKTMKIVARNSNTLNIRKPYWFVTFEKLDDLEKY